MHDLEVESSYPYIYPNKKSETLFDLEEGLMPLKEAHLNELQIANLIRLSARLKSKRYSEFPLEHKRLVFAKFLFETYRISDYE